MVSRKEYFELFKKCKDVLFHIFKKLGKNAPGLKFAYSNQMNYATRILTFFLEYGMNP